MMSFILTGLAILVAAGLGAWLLIRHRETTRLHRSLEADLSEAFKASELHDRLSEDLRRQLHIGMQPSRDRRRNETIPAPFLADDNGGSNDGR